MIFISAGHHYDEKKADPGAIGIGGVKEADLTIEFRDLVCAELDKLKAKYITDRDNETLAEYLARIKPGDASVLCEFHFNASAKPEAHGTEVVVRDGAPQTSWGLAYELAKATVDTCGVHYRSVLEEKSTPRKRIAILHTYAGISVLPEICFITNKKDLLKYQANKFQLARKYAEILKKYDDLI